MAPDGLVPVVLLAEDGHRSSDATAPVQEIDLPITSRMLGVDLDGTGRVLPAHVGCLVDPDGSRRTQTDRLDDHRDDQSASDKESDGKATGLPLRRAAVAWEPACDLGGGQRGQITVYTPAAF